MSEFSFVILHYMNANDTIDCIESIITTLSKRNYKIIVIDNGSTNNSYDIIKERFSNLEIVTMLRSERNVGFARGCNIGFKYAKYVLRSDFIILLNNDTRVIQADMLDKVLEIYNRTGFAVLGPDIIGLDGKHQIPQRFTPASNAEVNRDKCKLFIKLFFNYLHVDNVLVNVFRTLRHRNGLSNTAMKEAYSVCHYNVQLHGACLIFSPVYISRFDGLYDETFLYVEENILYHICTKERLKILYCPELKIIHKEYGSTDFTHTIPLLKRRFIYKQSIRSLSIYQKFMKNYETEIKKILRE